jgi:GTPase
MALPVIAIVGRPNVGKSSVLNRLVGRRISIVDPMAGVTRDRVSSPLAVGEAYAEIVDTGGFGIEDTDKLTEHVEAQIRYAIAEASLILFIVDAREGRHALDDTVAQLLRRQDKPVMLVANKCDDATLANGAGAFVSLGFGPPLTISALHGLGRSDLLEAIGQALEGRLGDQPKEVMKLGIVGKRNAGKSTLINTLAGQQRVIVSEKPGTTRDSVDVRIRLGDRELIAIDTAGVRKRKMVADNVEFYSLHRAQRTIRRCDVVLLMVDSTVPLGQVDKELAGTIIEAFKPVIVVVNKWDLAADKAAQEDYREYIDKMLPHLPFAPISFTTAIDGQNVRATIQLAQQLFEQASTRVSTGELNRVIGEIVALRGPSHKAGTKPPKVRYVTQVSTCPPTIVLFVNGLESFNPPYRRFLLNEMHDRLPFGEVPIRLLFRARPKAE